MNSDALGFRTPIRVVFRDLDVLAHVNHAVFFTYMETARTQFMLQRFGLDGPAALPVILAHASCRYLSPVRFDERLEVLLTVGRIGHKSFDLDYRIERASGEPVAEGKTVMVAYDYAAGASRPIPADVRERLEEFQAESTPVMEGPS